MNRRARSSLAEAVLVVLVWAVVTSFTVASSSVARAHWKLLVLASAVCGVVVALVSVHDPSAEHRAETPHRDPVNARRACARFSREESTTFPKSTLRPDQNEDAALVDADRGVAIVADGATSSYGSADWSQHLCRRFVSDRPAAEAASAERWLVETATNFTPETAASRDWWVDDASSRGAHAAYVGLTVDQAEDGARWQAVSVGDCLLVHLRPSGGEYSLLAGFPLEHSAGFGSAPALAASTARLVVDLPAIRIASGFALPGDAWLLMSDALGQWALRQAESGNPQWSLLLNGTASELRAAVDRSRADRSMVDDDVTLIRCVAA